MDVNRPTLVSRQQQQQQQQQLTIIIIIIIIVIITIDRIAHARTRAETV